MTRRTAERDLKTGKAAAACCVYEGSGQGSVEEGASLERQGPCGQQDTRMRCEAAMLNGIHHVSVLSSSSVDRQNLCTITMAMPGCA